MSVMTRWWWIRHAPVDSGGRIYGSSDPACDCSDRALFRGLARALPDPAVWVTSHLQRTRQTAQAVLEEWLEPHAASHGGKPEMLAETALGEQCFGDWQGLTHAELAETHGVQSRRFWLSPAAEVPPGGESFVQLMERVGGAVDRISQEHAGRDIIAVTHGGTIRAALGLALGLEAERALAFSIDNCSLTRIDHFHDPDHPEGPAWRVVTVNHLHRAEA